MLLTKQEDRERMGALSDESDRLCRNRAAPQLKPGPCGWPTTGIAARLLSDKNGDCANHTQKTYGGSWCIADGNYCLRTGPPEENRADCCLGKKAGIWQCGNNWCPNSAECKNVLSQQCGKAENMDNIVCQAFCTRAENKGFCDEMMSDFCGTASDPKNLNNPKCACYHSRLDRGQACFDVDCINFGYKSDNLIKQMDNCPEFCGAITQCENAKDCKLDKQKTRIYCPGATLPPSEDDNDDKPPAGEDGSSKGLWDTIVDWITQDAEHIAGVTVTGVILLFVVIIIVGRQIIKRRAA